MRNRIQEAQNLAQARKRDVLCDKELSSWLAEVRVMPHNLNATGNSTISAFRTFRVGQRFFWFDAWAVAYYEHTPDFARNQ